MQLLDVKQFSALLGVTQSCIRRWILERKVSTVKVGRLIRIPDSEAQRIVDAGFRPARISTGGHR